MTNNFLKSLVVIAVVLTAWYFYPQTADILFGADSGAKVTGTVESAGTWSTFTTTTLGTSDDSDASCGSPETSCTGQLSDYGFGVPAGATIDGITVIGELACAGLGCSQGDDDTVLSVALSWDNGTSYTAVKATTAGELTTTDANFTLGGVADTWGRTWSDTEFADGTFMASTTATNVSTGDALTVDFHTITVYYTEAVGVASNEAKISSGSIQIQSGTVKIQ